MDLYEMKSIDKLDLNKLVNVKADITAMWDGKEYDLSNGVQVKNGVLVAWKTLHKGVDFYTSDIEQGETPSREVKNPLEENDRGSAFSSLTTRGRNKK